MAIREITYSNSPKSCGDCINDGIDLYSEHAQHALQTFLRIYRHKMNSVYDYQIEMRQNKYDSLVVVVKKDMFYVYNTSYNLIEFRLKTPLVWKVIDEMKFQTYYYNNGNFKPEIKNEIDEDIVKILDTMKVNDHYDVEEECIVKDPERDNGTDYYDWC